MSSIKVSRQAFDNGAKANPAFYNFSIILTDLNDNAPKFERKLYDDLYINENNQLNQFVYKFTAVDLDAGLNAKLTYSVDLGSVSPKFVHIEASTGVLRASKVFDREERDVYEFYVIANDNSEQIEVRQTSRVKCRQNY